MKLKQLVDYLDQLLNVKDFSDYCPNGLQIEGKPNISKILTAVSIDQNVIDQAVAEKADAIIVHHGIFWKNDDPCLIGLKKQRIKALLEHDISLLAYHLPLDYHAGLGNNIQIAKILDFTITDNSGPYYIGEFPKTADPVAHIAKRLGHKPMHVPGKAKQIKTIAWCVGAAQDFIETAARQGIDAYLTGEVSERSLTIAQEAGIHLFVAGHDVTERYGIKALGEFLAQKFDLETLFVEPSPGCTIQ